MSDFQFAAESGELAAWEDQIGDHKDSAYDMTCAPCGCNSSFDTMCAAHQHEAEHCECGTPHNYCPEYCTCPPKEVTVKKSDVPQTPFEQLGYRELPDHGTNECTTCNGHADFGPHTCAYCHNEWCNGGENCKDHRDRRYGSRKGKS